jgi:hypothetical protein
MSRTKTPALLMRWSEMSLWLSPLCKRRAVEMAIEAPERKKKVGAQKWVMNLDMKGTRSAPR